MYVVSLKAAKGTPNVLHCATMASKKHPNVLISPIGILKHVQNVQKTYTKITNTVSTTMFFGLCTCKWGF